MSQSIAFAYEPSQDLFHPMVSTTNGELKVDLSRVNGDECEQK